MPEQQRDGGRLPDRSQAYPQAEHGTDSLIGLVTDLLRQVGTGGEWEGEESADERARGDRLARHRADEVLIQRLADQNFEGQEYDLFRAELASYALPVLRSWIRAKTIFDLCRRINRPLEATDQVREHLACDIDDRVAVASETIALALRLFHRYALAGGGWSPEGGASLKTYFVGACIRCFPTAFRRWVTEHDRHHRQQSETGAEARYLAVGQLDDPADNVISEQTVLDCLARMDSVTRELAARVVFLDETHEEAGRPHGLSGRAVEGRFYRYRTESRRRRRRRGGR
ncbi:hypothetical protein AB0E55_41325 [Amycolatopsis keratiniphila]|uniref:hypothetical protein n=1 Tax=Amycolatopsis keratiniphila TaxID=129921 RepID=UPI0033E0A68D